MGNDDDEFDPDKGIKEPGKNDVLSGRGNNVNFHKGNEYFRSLVKKYRVEYVACPKPLKGHFSKLIVDEIQALDPPGRFLKQDAKTKLWFEIDHKKSLDKTRQALREGAPEIMKELAPDGKMPNGFMHKTVIPQSIMSLAVPPPAMVTPPNFANGMIPTTFQHSIPGLLAQDGTNHISVQDMEAILAQMKRANEVQNSQVAAAQQRAAAAAPQPPPPPPPPKPAGPPQTHPRNQLDGHSISSDIFDESDEEDDEADSNEASDTANAIMRSTPQKRPSIILGAHDTSNTEQLSLSVSMDKFLTDENPSFKRLLETVSAQINESDESNPPSLDKIITPEQLGTIPVEQRSEFLSALSHFIQSPPASIDTNTNKLMESIDIEALGPLKKTASVRRKDQNMSDMSMSFSSLGTFDPYSLYPMKAEKEGALVRGNSTRSNRSRSRIDVDFNNNDSAVSLLDSMQMSLASMNMDENN